MAPGKSGVRHSFTLGASVEKVPSLVCDVVSGAAPLDETKVLSLFIKVYDVGAKTAVLCAIPALTEGARKLASLYKMVVIEAADKERAVSSLTENLGRLAKSG